MRSSLQLFLYFLPFCFLMNCSNKQTTKEQYAFKIPHVYNSDISETDSLEIVNNNVTQLLATNAGFMGIFKFCDSIDIGAKNDTARIAFINQKFKDSITENSQTGLELIVDYKTDVYSGSPGKVYFTCYPAYLVNNTNTGKMIYGKGGHILAIQEALDDTSWKPIEMRGNDFGGNGYWQKIIQPKEFALLLFLKYDGTQKTKLRVRIKNGDHVLISNAFNGAINPLQFIPKENSMEYQRIQHIKKNTDDAYFYGATIPTLPEN